MKTFIWLIASVMLFVFGVFGFGISVEVMLGIQACLIILLGAAYLFGSQAPESSKFFTWFCNLFGR